MASSVFDLPDYAEHVPMKKKVLDINNVKDKQRQNDHLYSDLFGQSGTSHKAPVTPAKAQSTTAKNTGTGKKPTVGREAPGFNRKVAKFGNLKSALDNHDYDAQPNRPIYDDPVVES